MYHIDQRRARKVSRVQGDKKGLIFRVFFNEISWKSTEFRNRDFSDNITKFSKADI